MEKRAVMGMWIIILGTIMASGVVALFYMTWAVKQFGFIDRISKGKKWVKNLVSLALVALYFLIFYFSMSTMNAIIALLALFIFRLFFGIVGRIMKAAGVKPCKVYWQGWCALAAAAIYLIVGFILCHHVWITEYNLKTDKDLGELRIAMFADSHLSTTLDGEEFGEQMKRIEELNPDILFIVGDFVDDSTTCEDMEKACDYLGQMNIKYGVWYVYGNHDRGYSRAENRGFDEKNLIASLKDNNVNVVKDDVLLVDDRFYVVGREDAYDNSRETIEELMSKVDDNKYAIVLNHQPTDYDNEAKAGADLVLSGHTHGGQLFPVNHVGDWFNINDRTYGYERRGNTDFIVTSGISSWEIQFKTGTKSEIVMITVNG